MFKIKVWGFLNICFFDRNKRDCDNKKKKKEKVERERWRNEEKERGSKKEYKVNFYIKIIIRFIGWYNG